MTSLCLNIHKSYDHLKDHGMFFTIFHGRLNDFLIRRFSGNLDVYR